jgi:hypothetical protein
MMSDYQIPIVIVAFLITTVVLEKGNLFVSTNKDLYATENNKQFALRNIGHSKNKLDLLVSCDS